MPWGAFTERGYLMIKRLGNWLKIYEDEITLFLWCAALLFLIRSSSILFNNFAETAFLKRYGVEYLPLVYVVNSISTFIIMGFMTGLIGGVPGSRLLTYMLGFCGLSVAGLRFVVPLGIDLLYPVLFVLKAQYEVLLGLLFWNLANDLFNTRQSKRIFPLITAGGVLGGVIGSFATPPLAKFIALDNLMFAYLGTALSGAFLVRAMGLRFPTLLLSDKKTKKTRKRLALVEEFKKVLPLIKESTLVKILILLTLMPNVAIPIMNYQFNYAIDQSFATEGGMIQFFGYFRGVLNVISLIILLFVGRLYGRWGLPVALMFHPFNYVLAFLAFLLRFDIFSAMYARISTNVLRTTINNPAREVLMGLFPVSYRAAIRPFLRGTVVRIGVLTGAGIIMLSERIFHPRYLSIAGCVFIGAWIVSTFALKRNYSKILLNLISRNMLDLKSMEDQDVGHVFRDKTIRSQLIQNLSSARGQDAVWYAKLLKSLEIEDLDTHILELIRKQDDRVKIGLLPLVSAKAGAQGIRVFRELLDPGKPELSIAVIEAANRFPPESVTSFNQEVFDAAEDLEIKARTIRLLYTRSPEKYQALIASWLQSSHGAEKKAGIIAAGESGDAAYAPLLKDLLGGEEDGRLIAEILKSLSRLGAEGINEWILPYLSHPLEPVRRSALESFDIRDDEAIRRVILLLDDESDEIRELAKGKLIHASYRNMPLLVESMGIPRRNIREGLSELLQSLNIKDLDVFKFARTQLERSYRNMAELEALNLFSEGRERDLLIAHLNEKRKSRLDHVLRVLAIQDGSGQMRLIWRGLSSVDSRQRSNSLEALEDFVDPSLGRIMVPLLEDLPADQCLAQGRRTFKLPRFDADPAGLCAHLLEKYDWVTLVLSLFLVGRQGHDGLEYQCIEKLNESDNRHVRQMAGRVLAKLKEGPLTEENPMEAAISIPDKILHLRKIQIFEGLAVSELAAVASVTEEVEFPEGEVVIRQGDPGDTMYLIIRGEVVVLKQVEKEGEDIELDRIKGGDYFGEMALFEDNVRSATIRTAEDCRFLVLHKREFAEIVREYPQIALHICKVLSNRLLRLHEKLRTSSL